MDRFDDSYLPRCDNVRDLAEDFRDDNLNLDAETDDSNNLLANLNVDSDRHEGHQLVEFILQCIDMEKYIDLFATYNISLDAFLNVKEADLIAIGISNANDRETILKNVESHRRDPEKYAIKENHEEDLIIAKNILNQLVFMQKYAAFLEYKWIQNNYKDYEGDKQYPPAKCLQMLAQRSLAKCDSISNIIYQCSSSEHLIGTLLQTHKMTLPKYLDKKVSNFKNKNRYKVLRITAKTLLGITLLTFFTVRYGGKVKQTFWTST